MARIWVLGAADPEMEAIEALLQECGETIEYAAVDGARVHPGNAYRANCPAQLQGGNGETWDDVYRVECAWDHSYESLACLVTTIDHHRPGDPGFGRSPQEFFSASSLGQVIHHLDESATSSHLLIAAADHCLGAAYRGECPGVDPTALGHFRAAQRARFQSRAEPGVTAEVILARIAETQAALMAADEVVVGESQCPWHAAGHRRSDDCQNERGSEYATDPCRVIGVRDMRRETPWPELPEAATRLGVGYMSGPLVCPDGRHKFTCSGSTLQVSAWLQEWAPAHGLVGLYGDPARGFAGGYTHHCRKKGEGAAGLPPAMPSRRGREKSRD